MTGIILAGGASRRMGTDKAFLNLGGVALIGRVVGLLRTVFSDIIIVTNKPYAFGKFGTVIVTDAFDCEGPLTGIYSGLSHARDEYGFVVACDMPFLNPSLISFMAECAVGHEAVVPFLDGRYEPLHAVYRKTLLPAVRDRIETGKRRIQDLFQETAVLRVTEADVDRFDAAHRSFRNLNTPEEFEKEAVCAD